MNNSNLLNSKVILVTGGTRGIGKAMVQKFCEHGAKVAFTYLNSDAEALNIENELTQQGFFVKSFKSNAAVFKEAETLIANVLNHFQAGLHVLVNNAGITRDNLLLRASEQQWNEVMDTNLKSIFNTTKHALRPMLQQKKGCIINVGSIVGLTGNAGQSIYAASKAGIIAFSKSVAHEVGSRNIRCNVLSPGYIATDMTNSLSPEKQADFFKNISLQRFGTPEEIANTAVFLASDLASYITGQVISVCGGLYK